MTPLAPRLAAALELIAVSADCRTGRVNGREVSAGSAAALRHKLGQEIYAELHVGHRRETPAGPGFSRDEKFEADLLAVTPHRYLTREVPILGEDGDDFRVEMEGVKVRLPRAHVTGPPDRVAGRLVCRVPATRPALSPGFFVAEGSHRRGEHDPLLRVYVHLRTRVAAIAAWAAVLGWLEHNRIGYQAKVSSAAELLPRRDGLVLYLPVQHCDVVPVIAGLMAGLDGVGAQVSVFAERVGPGVAIAHEPDDPRPGMRGLSFGEHRAQALAAGLVQHAQAAHTGSVTSAVRRSLLDARIDPANPACNVPGTA
ncbi:MAG: T3SS effector HopA1 family protein [Streptosporangiaceae bacterium]